MSWSSWFGGGGGDSGDSGKPSISDTYSDTGSFSYETVPSPGSSSVSSLGGGGGGGGGGDFEQQVQQQALIAELQKRIGQLSSVCWDKCMTAYPKSQISGREEACVSNCAERYVDVSLLIAQQLSTKFGGGELQ